jgi:uncharacterized protein (TIGR00369 family)
MIGPDDLPCIGSVSVLLDHVLGEPVLYRCPPARSSVTTEFSFDVLRPPPWHSEGLTAYAWKTSLERFGGFTQGRMVDDAGHSVAVASAWARFVPRAPTAAQPHDNPGEHPHTDLGHANVETLAEYLQTRTITDADTATVMLTDRRQRWANLNGSLHGGIWACLCEMAASTLFCQHRALSTSSMHVAYLRPPASSSTITVRAHLAHAGRSFAVVAAAGTDNANRECVRATITGRQPH